MFRDYYFPKCVIISDCFSQFIVNKDYYFPKCIMIRDIVSSSVL